MRQLEADGDVWEATVERDGDQDGTSAIVFHCVSNGQRPYRVAGISTMDVREIESWSERDMLELFATSQTMDLTGNDDAQPETHGQAERAL